jgi:hypothetical protein
MANLTDAERTGRTLPGIDPNNPLAVWNGKKFKGFAWTWNERIDPKKARVPNPSVLAIRTADLDEKDALIAAEPDKFFTEPHYGGYPAVLVRLANVDNEELEELLIDGWRCTASKALLMELEVGANWLRCE